MPINTSSPARILVTGASGFIGQAVCRQLRQGGCRVIALNRHAVDGPWDEQYGFDLSRKKQTDAVINGSDAVVHLAGIAHSTDFADAAYREINTLATVRFAEFALAQGVNRFIFMSSNQAERASAEERDAGAYPLSKYQAELGLRELSDTAGLQLTVLRPSLVYGPGVKGNLRSLLRAVIHRWLPPLPESEGGISMISLNDLAAAVHLTIHTSATIGRVYNLDDGEIYNPARIQSAALAALGRPPVSWRVPYRLLSFLARVGDFGLAAGVNLPLTSSSLDKLFADTASHSDELHNDTDWVARYRLEDKLPEILSAWQDGR